MVQMEQSGIVGPVVGNFVTDRKNKQRDDVD